MSLKVDLELGKLGNLAYKRGQGIPSHICARLAPSFSNNNLFAAILMADRVAFDGTSPRLTTNRITRIAIA